MFRGSFAFMCFEAAECSAAFMRLGTETSCRGQNIPYGVLYLLGMIHTIIIETARIAWRAMVGRGTLLWRAMVGRGDIAVADYGWPGGHRCGGQKIEDVAARAASLKVSR